MKEKRVFRHPTTNARYTRQLFWECQQEIGNVYKTIDPMFTLYQDKPGLVNFRKEYVKLGDPTGYKLANAYLEDFSHWQLLMKAPWFKKAKAVWDLELDAKLKSEAMEAIKLIADSGSVSPAVQLQAAKFLANLEHRKQPKQDSTRGRPSKEEVEGELKRQTEDSKTIEADMARIGFDLRKGK
jgi:hypothetical protein